MNFKIKIPFSLFDAEFVLCNVFTPTPKALDIKLASPQREIHKCMKEDEDI